MSKAPPAARNYRHRGRNATSDDDDDDNTRPGDAYRRGLAISQLQAQFYEDAAQLPAPQMERLYGRDHKDSVGFLETREHDRPTSKHLRSPFFVDQHGLEYTPRDVPIAHSLFVRIPRSKAVQLRKRLNQADTFDDLEETGLFCFPKVGEQLSLRVHKRFPAALKREMENEQWSVVVADMIEPKQASAELVLTAELRIDRRLCADPKDDKI
jgi:hypothetical protein